MFDTALLESRRDRRGRRKGAGLPLAIALHAAVIGAFVGASVWSAGEPAEPVTPMTFFVPVGPPPPPRGDGGRSHESVRPRRAIAPTIDLPTNPEIPSASPDSEGPEYSGADTGKPPGDPNGVDKGTGELPALGPGPGVGEGPRIVGGDVKAPVLVFRTEPDYPESLRRARVEGVVILEAVITADGAVEQLRVLRSANPLLDRTVLDAVRQWRYKPATLNGRAVPVYLTVTVTFGLRS